MAPKHLLSNYQQLKQAIEEEDEDLIHSTLEKLLSNDKNNNELKQLKIINQIQKGEFNKVIENSQSTNFQKIYSLYRLNKSEEALKIIQSNRNELNTNNDLLLSYLEAQINYRIGNYENSSKLYEKILSIEYPNKKDNIENDELLTNLSASYTMNGNYEKGIEITKKSDHNTYELAYNASCGSIGLKDYEQAEKYLEFSQKLCKEDENEISSILVQLAYVKYLNGQVDISKKLFEQVFTQSKESVAGAVAANNLVAILDVTTNNSNNNINSNVTHFDLEAQKKLKHAYQDKLQGKLTTEQIRGVTLNNCLLQLHLGKFEECEKIIKNELEILFKNSEIPILILSHLYFKQKKFDQSIQLLKNYISNNSNITNNGNTNIELVLVQLYLQQSKYKECIELLKESTLINEKSIQSLLIALYMKIDDMNSALDLLQQVITKLSNTPTRKDELIEMASELAKLQLQFKKYQQASQTFEMLIKLDSKNISLHTAGLIEAMSFYDIDAAEKYCKDLNINSIKSLNIDDIEKTTSIISNTTTTGSTTSTTSSLSISKIDIQPINGSNTNTNTNNGSKMGGNRQADALNRGEKKKQRKKRRNKLPIHSMLNEQGETFKSRWESKKKHSSHLMGFGHQGSSDAEAQKSVLHKKGQKTLLTPEQVLRSGSGAGSGGGANAASAMGLKKKKKR